jgi:integrase
MPLSDAKVRAAKPSEKIKKLSDGNGLQLCVMPTGGKLWRLAYRFGGKERTLSLGGYPIVGIADARRASEAARTALAKGVDPNAQKKADALAKAAGDAITFAVVAAELVEKKRNEGKAPQTIVKLTWLFEKAAPFIGDLPIAGITAGQVLVALQDVERAGRHETAKRLRAVIGEVFRFAIATGRAVNDPTSALRGALTAPTVTHRPAITDPKALGGLLRAIDGFDGQPTTLAYMRLLPLLFSRPGELRFAEWREFDLEKAVWEIPAARMKMRKPHAIPLPTQTIEILNGLRQITGRGVLLFPGLRASNRPISDNTMNAALRRLGYGQDEMTAHGFRATASTLLNESGKWSPDAIERALAHADPDRIRAIYSRGSYWNERVQMMQAWADYLGELREVG